MSEAKPFSRSWMYGAIRHVCRNVDHDCYWFPDAGEDKDEAHVPYYSGGNDIAVLSAAPVMLEALQAVRDGKPEATALVERALQLAGEPC